MSDISTDPLYITTPCIYSSTLSNIANAQVYLKLEQTQPSGSFKLRGIGHMALLAVKERGFYLQSCLFVISR
jgi:threonine dehydratase